MTNLTVTEMHVKFSIIYEAYGDVDNCIRYVQRLFEAGADEVLFLLQMGTVPNDVVMETIRNIGERVIPYFRKGTKARAAE